MSAVTADLAALASLTGLELWQRIASGALPAPTMATLIGMDAIEVAEGTATFSLTPDHRMLNPYGSVHGGIAAALLDSAMACAVHTTLEPGVGLTTAQLNLHYLRSMQPGMGRVRATGTVLHRGRKQATAEAKLVDSEGRLLAHGTTMCLILGA
jgi:uncharacterized protein (TIGR00369 family)